MSKLGVFIIEDSQLMCTRLSQIIAEIDGAETLGVAGNVPEALKRLKGLHADLIILDICLPGESGLGFLEKIRSLEFRAKIIVFTQYAYPQYRTECLRLGAQYFLDKSIEFPILLEIINTLAREHKQRNSSS